MTKSQRTVLIMLAVAALIAVAVAAVAARPRAGWPAATGRNPDPHRR